MICDPDWRPCVIIIGHPVLQSREPNFWTGQSPAAETGAANSAVAKRAATNLIIRFNIAPLSLQL